jgi:HSP20 family molecular chaperone IbpA
MTTTNPASLAKNAIIEPLVDVYEVDQLMHILADLPGVNNDNLNIQVNGQMVTIEGVLSLPTADGDGKGFEEVKTPYYMRSLPLSSDLDAASIKAHFVDGVLTLKVAKRADSQPRKLAVDFD